MEQIKIKGYERKTVYSSLKSINRHLIYLYFINHSTRSELKGSFYELSKPDDVYINLHKSKKMIFIHDNFGENLLNTCYKKSILLSQI